MSGYRTVTPVEGGSLGTLEGSDGYVRPHCQTYPHLFFGGDGEQPKAREARENQAATVCAWCPHRAPCLAGARARGEEYGVWGGVSMERPRPKDKRSHKKQPGPPKPRPSTGGPKTDVGRAYVARRAARPYRRGRGFDPAEVDELAYITRVEGVTVRSVTRWVRAARQGVALAS